jgi:hypothetical protein
MDETDAKPKTQSAAEIGCLAFIVGAGVGFAVLYFWSNSQVHTTHTGYVLRGDHRAFVVLGDAFVGAIAGGGVASVIALIWRLLKTKGRKFRKPTAIE